eukprot:TRINITY_DN19322_c0_g1_i1.p1 TRINITY_DN19322_c0_g1~~TRINITY_DN19322_c0_g1_i1.p1  ORF type:complete len:253 (-),score=46.55 TRINITY_DN19322_c0_g1_i1:482-1240(-)
MAEELDANGVCVQRSVCAKEVTEHCLAEVLRGLDDLRALPASMAEADRPSTRYFIPVMVTRPISSQVAAKCSHRRDFKLAMSPPIEAVMKCVLSGSTGAAIAAALGGHEAELMELTAIISLPGAPAQDIHSDTNFSEEARRQVTMFMALHDILDERIGPTYFCPQTHAPRLFPPEEKWLPPTPDLVAQRGGTTWFELCAGDLVLMDSLTWHGGGANTSESTSRILLSATFQEAGGVRPTDKDVLRLVDMMAA